LREKAKNDAIAAQRVEDKYLATNRDEAAYRDTIARTAAEKPSFLCRPCLRI
jgi:maltoporin